jgi:hypothetical protein
MSDNHRAKKKENEQSHSRFSWLTELPCLNVVQSTILIADVRQKRHQHPAEHPISLLTFNQGPCRS